MPDPLFSLVLTTVGRTSELERYLSSLRSQTYKNVELIIVDQNEDDRLAPILEAYSHDIPIQRVVSSRGSSRGRNAGLAHVSGDIIAFPDDDCAYGPDLLERVRRFFATEKRTDVLTGAARDWTGGLVGKWDRKAGPLTRNNVWYRGIAFAMFFRRGVLQRLGSFDEQIGPGSANGFIAGEETDLLIRAIDLGARTHYDPTLVVLHPDKKLSDAGLRRAFGYGAGIGYVLRKNGTDLRQLFRVLARPIGGMVVSLVLGQRAKARYHALTFSGRVWGYLASPPYYKRAAGLSKGADRVLECTHVGSVRVSPSPSSDPTRGS